MSRYKKHQKLKGTSEDIRTSDIFSLGLTSLKCLTLEHIPKNGRKWFQLRSDYKFECLTDLEFGETVTEMILSEESKRPKAKDLIDKFKPEFRRRKVSLISMLQTEKSKNSSLAQ